MGPGTRDSTSAVRSALVRTRTGGTVQVQRRDAGRQVCGDGGRTLRRQRGRAEPRAEGRSERPDGHAGCGPGEEGVAGVKRGGRAWRGPFVMSHGACGRLRKIGSSRRPAPLSLYPVRQSAAHPHRYWLGMVRTSRTSSAGQDARGRDVAFEAEDLRVPRVVFRNIASTRAGSVSTPAELGGTGRGWWRLRDGTGHPDHSFLLCMWIARGRPVRALSSRFGKHKYGFHGGAADPPHLRLRPGLFPPCRVIPIATRSNPNDQPLRRHRPRQVHRYRWPGAHPFSARGCDVPQHPQRGWIGILRPQARLPGRGLGAGDVPAERERSPGLNPLTRMGRPRTIRWRPGRCSTDAGSGGQITRGDLTKLPVSTHSTDALPPE
uniref:RC174 n=1 Tax=Ruegeria sp. PR1b TaxID=185588 RepID=Q8KW16_9RHOB|nr:RC174 [Ruegeria sp. PR1b]